jgi:hypothetical protein
VKGTAGISRVARIRPDLVPAVVLARCGESVGAVPLPVSRPAAVDVGRLSRP